MENKFYLVRHHLHIVKEYEVLAESDEEAWDIVDQPVQDLREYEYEGSSGLVVELDPETGEWLAETSFR